MYVLTYTCVLPSVSVALKIRSKRGVVTRSTISMWRDYLTNYGHQVLMKESQIDELKSGLEFGKAIRLPPDLTFSAVHMCDLLIFRNTVRYFEYLRLVSTTL